MITTNADQLADRFRAAAANLLRGLDGSEGAMAAVIVAAARPPRATGAYAATLRATGTPARVSITAGGGPVDYANIIEFGSRYVPGRRVLSRAAESSETAWTAIAADAVQRIIDRI